MKSLIGGVLNKTPVPYSPKSNSGRLPIKPRGDESAMLSAFGSVGTLFAIVDRTANAVSQVKWHLYRKAESGKDEDRVEVTRHAALVVWNKPNPFYTRQELVETCQQHYELVGETELLIGRSNLSTMPIELWPVRPDRMAPIPHPVDFLSGWIYKGPDGEKVPLDLDEVIQLRRPNPKDPFRGIGPVQSILTDIDSARYSAEWNRNFFLNSAEPGGIVEVAERLSDDEFNEMRERWNEQHRGVARSHRVAILEQGKWVDRSFNMKDMQFAELRGVAREIIREAFGFPKPLLGSVDDVNRANADAGEYVFAKWLVVNRLERWKQALNNDFLPMFGPEAAQGLEFDYENPVPADMQFESADRTSRVNAAVALIGAGADPKSTLEAMGLPEIEWRVGQTQSAPSTVEPGGE